MPDDAHMATEAHGKTTAVPLSWFEMKQGPVWKAHFFVEGVRNMNILLL
jgi:hypothetical protein